jgi:DNA-binding transcriptional ArsR family regulator
MGTDEPTVWSVSNPVIIPFDNDKSGREGAEKLAKALKMRFPNMVVLVSDWRKLGKKYKAGADITDIEHSDFITLIEKAPEWKLTMIGGLEIMRGRDYQSKEPEPIEFIIEHLLPMNFNTLLGGETGSNKSYFSMQKAMCIANNESQFLGFKILKKNLKVFYIDTEIGKQLMHNRYCDILQNFKPWVGGDRFDMASFKGSDNLWGDIDKAVSILKPDYVVIDCLYNVNQWGGDLGKAPDMTKITTALSRLRSKFNITVESIAHFIKGLKESGLDSTRVAGSQALQNWVQHMILIINVPTDDALRFMKIAKARTAHYPRDTFALEWHHKDQWLTMRGIVEDPTKYLMSLDEVNKMYGLIANIRERVDKDGFFPTEMAYNAGDELSISRSTTRRHLKSAVTAGLVADEGHGKWRLTGLQTIEFDKYESDEEDDSE